jgi:hypothetical protein
MSRHTIPSFIPNLTITVGWDAPMQTYFAQVIRDNTPPDEDPMLLWIGGFPKEVTQAEDLITPLAPYVTLTSEHIAQLRADQAAQLDRGPSPLQRELLDVVNPSTSRHAPR